VTFFVVATAIVVLLFFVDKGMERNDISQHSRDALLWLIALPMVVLVLTTIVWLPIFLKQRVAQIESHGTYHVNFEPLEDTMMLLAFAFFAAWYGLLPRIKGWTFSAILVRFHVFLTAVALGVMLTPLASIFFAGNSEKTKALIADYSRLNSACFWLIAASVIFFLINTLMAGYGAWRYKSTRSMD
jgi:hypothetical protein